MGKTIRKNDENYSETVAEDIRHQKKNRKIDRMMKSRKGQAKVLKTYIEEEE